jgi:hypothetical protein
MNFTTIRVRRPARNDTFQFGAIRRHRPTKPAITLYVCEIDPSVLCRFATLFSRP